MNNSRNHGDIPRPTEAVELELKQLRANEAVTDHEAKLEDYFVDNLSEAYLDEELDVAVHGFVAEARLDPTMELARLLVAREQLKSRKSHPMFDGLKHDDTDQKIAEIDEQIRKRKQELNPSRDT